MVGEDADPAAAFGQCAVSQPQALAAMVVVRSHDADKSQIAVSGPRPASTVANALRVVVE
jgi:hypothetical protein